MSIGLVTAFLFGGLFLFIILGVPLYLALGGVGLLGIFLFWGPEGASVVVSKLYGVTMNYSFLALPLFTWMATLLQESGLGTELYGTMRKWFGGLKGGLAAGTIIISAMFAAMSGESGPACIGLGLFAIPPMLKYKYDKQLITGSIQGGSALGTLIPPSIIMILFGIFGRVPIGKLFMAGIIPGIMLAVLFILYILTRCQIQPSLGPPIPAEEKVSWKERFVSLKDIILPIMIIVFVLGSIYGGIASVTESAAMGVLGTFLAIIIQRRFSWSIFVKSVRTTLVVCCLCLWIIGGAFAFAAAYTYSGATTLVEGLLNSVPGGAWGTLIMMQLTFFLLGFAMDEFSILMITAPVYLPIATSLGFNPVWYGILYVMNMQMAVITPPFGFNLFYMKAVCPPEITMGDLYRSVFPFVIIQLIGLILVMVFPQLALWLPAQMLSR